MKRWLSLALLCSAGCADRPLDLPVQLPQDAGAGDLARNPGDPDFAIARDLSTVADLAPDLSTARDLSPAIDASGTLTLLAGQLGGWGNVDGVGATARLNLPFGITSDGAGNLFVVDYGGGGAIRKIVIATGAVTTLAGGSGIAGLVDGVGAAAQFNGPRGITNDGAGNLYVTDTYNGTIRKVVIATGAVTSLLPKNQFSFPLAIASDRAGHLYIGDGDEIVELDLATSTQTSLWMNAAGLAYDGAGSLYVTDDIHDIVSKVDLATGLVTIVAGTPELQGSADGTGAAAQFYFPFALALDGAGNLYVTDAGNHTIRKIVIATGAVTTLADTSGNSSGNGGGPPSAWPDSLAADGAGNLYFTDQRNNTIRKVAIASATVTSLAGVGQSPGDSDGSGARASFNHPLGIAYDGAGDGAGNVYLVDSTWALGGNALDIYGNTIRKIELATGNVTTLAGTAGVTGSADGIGAQASFNSPMGIASDGAGNLYVSDSDNRISGSVGLIIRKIVIATGATSTVASVPANVQIDGVGALAFEGGALYVSGGDAIVLYQVAVDSGTVTAFAGDLYGNADGNGTQARFSAITGVTGDGLGNLYLADLWNDAIRKVVIGTGAVTTLATDSSLSLWLGISSDRAGNLYVVGQSTVQKVTISTGVVETIAGVPGHFGVQLGPLPASLACPAYLAVAGGNLILTDRCENAVLMLNGE